MAERVNYGNAAETAEVRPGGGKRPYPGVRRHKGSWVGVHSMNSRKIHLGSYPTAEAARVAVLLAQADYLEKKAQHYRDEAELLRSKA